MSLELMKKSLYEAPIVKKGDYDYVIHPITDGIPYISSKLLKEVSDVMKKHIKKYKKIDRIVTMEAMGIPLASALSLNMGIPFTPEMKRAAGSAALESIAGFKPASGLTSSWRFSSPRSSSQQASWPQSSWRRASCRRISSP